MNPFTGDQVEALRNLREIWPESRFSLVGAVALACQMTEFHRQTHDLDASAAVSLDDLTSDLRRLPGWERDPKIEHRWRAPTGARVDLIPAGPDLLAAGQVTWPSGRTMSLLGFRHAFERVQSLTVAPGLPVSVAGVPVVVLLKMVAYQDRPHERGRDLGDISFVLEHYLAADDSRRYSEEVLSAGIAYEETSSFVLGRDMAGMADAAEARVVETFVSWAEKETDGGRAQALMLQQGPSQWRNQPRELLRAIAAFKRGFAGR